MSKTANSFSSRFGFKPDNPPVTVWKDAPQEFRTAILRVARDDCKLSPNAMREVVCKILRKKPNANNRSPEPVWTEVENLVEQADWFKVYDLVEAIWNVFGQNAGVEHRGKIRQTREVFTAEVNELMAEYGIGWQLTDGQVQVRGEETHEAILAAAASNLEKAGKSTALNELAEAIKDISRRPEPDSSGAIQHAMAALECVARDVSGDPKPTLGKLLKKHPQLLPEPVNEAVEKMWGYASDNARHGREGNMPTREEAMLCVGLAITLTNYLIRKTSAA